MTIKNSLLAEDDPSMTQRIRLAVVASHPIQYYAPFYRALTANSPLDVHAIFASRIGYESMLDPGMGVELSWKMDLLGGYSHEFLPEAAKIRRTGFREVDNPSVGAALARFRPDVVLLHGYANMTMLRALTWCRRRRVPTLMISDSSLHGGTGLAGRAIKRAMLPMIFRQYSAFLSIGDANQRYLEAFGVSPQRIFSVPNMVDEGFWAFRERRADERAKRRAALGLTDDDLAALFVGKLIARKRPADLLAALDALRHLPPTKRKVRVLFVGDGERRAELESAAQGLPAQFLGFINVDELPSIYCAADVLVHAAEIETFGVIVLEAAVLGLPLVLSDRVGAIGPTSIARSGENALVYRCGETDALAQALRRLADENESLDRMGRASLAISEELDGRKSVSGTIAAVEYCLGRRPDTMK